MIKPSDINVSVYEARKSYRADTIVDANLTITETSTIYAEWANDTKVIERTKEMVKNNLYHKLYGDLREAIEEMYAIVMVKMPYGAEFDKVRELKGQIDRIMRGGE